MKNRKIMVIDGYNVINRVPAFRACLDKSLRAARESLSGFCLEWKSLRRDIVEFVVVFDGDSVFSRGTDHSPLGIRFVFSRKGETADDCIRQMLEEGLARGGEFVVVSDDSEVKRHARANEASVMDTMTFFQSLRGRKGKTGKASSSEKAKLTEKQKNEINEHLRMIYGIE